MKQGAEAGIKPVILLILLILFTISTTYAEAMVRKIVIFHDNITQEEITAYIGEWEAAGASLIRTVPFIHGIILSVPDTITSDDLANDYRVAMVEGDQTVQLQSLTATADGGSADGGSADGGSTSYISPVETITPGQLPWGILRMLQLPYDPNTLTSDFGIRDTPVIVKEARRNASKKGIRVAVFDSGVQPDHPNLVGTITGGADLISMTPGIPQDSNGHGTHVGGTLFAHTGDPRNSVGLAYGTPFYSVRVLDENAIGDVSTLIMGLQWAIDNAIDVVNMSIAYSKDRPAVHLAVQKAFEAGIVMVAAVGNHSNWDDPVPTASADGGSADGGSADSSTTDGETTATYPVMYPAAYPEVIGVGALNSFGEMTEFSNEGPETDVLAPGADIVSLNMGSAYGLCSGTSMAVPFVTGAVAMMKGLNSYLTPGDIISIIKSTAINSEIDLMGALEAAKAQ